MGRRKRKWTARPFESLGERFQDPNTGAVRADTSAAIFESMLLSPAYMDLSTRQKQLYLICKAQYYGHRKPGADFPDVELVSGDDVFYLNLGAVVRYGLYTRNMRGKFYADMKELENHGFIETVSSGKSTKTKSIYRFSPGWKYWTATPEK